MTGIDRYISELLFHHDCVILPGFGGFITNYSGARIHPIKHNFYPPSRTVVFNANLRTSDGLLIDHISRSENISYQEATQWVNEFTVHCFDLLNSGNSLELKNIGSCRMGKENNIIFDPDLSANYLEDAFGLPSFVSPAIKRETVRQRLEKQLTPRPTAPSEKKNRNLAPVLGWVAGITIPVALAMVLYFTNPSFVDGMGGSYASFVPTVKFSKAEDKSISSADEKSTLPKFRVIPEKVAETAVIIAEQTPEQEPKPEAKAVEVHVLKKYQIVVGAFSSEANASKYVSELKNKDFDAAVVGNSRNGLIRVGINGSDSKSESIIILDQVRAEENPSAWLLRIR